ncbi:MAG: hypothetical protein OHK0024_28040 [Thalassobaculales bacterium]
MTVGGNSGWWPAIPFYTISGGGLTGIRSRRGAAEGLADAAPPGKPGRCKKTQQKGLTAGKAGIYKPASAANGGRRNGLPTCAAH